MTFRKPSRAGLLALALGIGLQVSGDIECEGSISRCTAKLSTEGHG
jgi:hypothetical protein